MGEKEGEGKQGNAGIKDTGERGKGKEEGERRGQREEIKRKRNMPKWRRRK